MEFLRNTKSRAATPTAGLRNRSETSIGADASITGAIKSDSDVRVDGTFEGQLEVAGNVIVGATGRVVASINATNIHVSGAVKGDLTATGRVEISETGKVWGDITTGALHIEPGAVFQGQSAMVVAEEPMLLDAPSASDT